jgi:hypothetical protein
VEIDRTVAWNYNNLLSSLSRRPRRVWNIVASAVRYQMEVKR